MGREGFRFGACSAINCTALALVDGDDDLNFMFCQYRQHVFIIYILYIQAY